MWPVTLDWGPVGQKSHYMGNKCPFQGGSTLDTATPMDLDGFSVDLV